MVKFYLEFYNNASLSGFKKILFVCCLLLVLVCNYNPKIENIRNPLYKYLIWYKMLAVITPPTAEKILDMVKKFAVITPPMA